MNPRRQVAKYLISDFLTAGTSWTLFFVFRKIYFEPKKFGYLIPVDFNDSYFLGLAILPALWLLLYYTTGYYKDVYRKSRLSELGQTIGTTFLGVLLIFFALILDDTIVVYTNYYLSFFVLFSLHFTITYIPRLSFTTSSTHKIHKRIIGFPTLLVGSDKKALELYEEMESQPKSTGNKFIGFVNVRYYEKYLMASHLPNLGELKNINKIIEENNVRIVLIAIESHEHELLKTIINRLESSNVVVKVIPDMYDILTGMVKMSTIIGTPLIQISHDLMPTWEESLKRIMDVLLSIFALIVLSPAMIFMALGVKFSSPGSILYSHERIGRYGKPFVIFKFRSMVNDAEKSGPALSSQNDARITRFGLFMRKMRFDELPQFYNVLIGDMSLVGPRPERQFFIDQIVAKAPHFHHLQKVRPGITSWGQVKFGYASDVDEMIQRLKYDILYIENMSLLVDLKIMIYTIKTVMQGSGK